MIAPRFQFLVWGFVAVVSSMFAFTYTVQATELSSTNYTLITEGFGTTDGSMLSSENYSVVVKNQSYTYGTSSDTGGGDDDGDTDGEGTQTGSRSTRVDRRINPNTLPEIIVGSQLENQNIQRNNNVPPILRGRVLEDVPVPNEIQSDSLKEINTSGSFSDTNLDASLIGAWIGGHFQDTFAERGARALLFISVLLFLFIIRTYTRIGKKYSPF